MKQELIEPKIKETKVNWNKKMKKINGANNK